MRLLLATVMSVAMLCTAHASSGPNDKAGAGTISCAKYTADSRRDQSDNLIFFSWAQGFMTATNISRSINKAPTRDLNGVNIDTQIGMIEEYCSSHPRNKYSEAAQFLYDNLPGMKPDPEE